MVFFSSTQLFDVPLDPPLLFGNRFYKRLSLVR